MSRQETINKIERLRKEKKAIILAHVYTPPEVQDIADYVGDSLGLSQKAADPDLNCEIIVFAGVSFMAETAALLSPTKKVLLPDMHSGCPMAEMASIDKIREIKKKHPEATVISYVNTTAEVKAESDICVTSSNAVKIVKQLDARKIIFLPDKSLGAYVQKQVPEKEIILFPGFCPTHHRILRQFVERAKEEHPGALVLAHPENTEAVLELADYIGSTGQIQKFAAKSDKKEFIIVTENGILYRLQKDNPDKFFFGVTQLATCRNMQKNTLSKIAYVLETETNVIEVKPQFREKALAAINKMLEMS